ncbi:MAG: PD40 domain-containing protein [Bacteroidetes bacterium]|nr:PD40 domain-containing protein [Bacteroidota bacterium]
MKHSKFILFFVLIFALNQNWFSQVSTEFFEKITSGLKKTDILTLNKAKEKFYQESYLEALPHFEKLLTNNPKLIELNYLIGICYSYDANNVSKAIQYINKANPKANEIDGYYFNLAYALEKNDSIDRAIENYRTALIIEEKSIDRSNKLIEEIKYRINRCKKINEFKRKKNNVRISNIGKPINSNASEYCPLITSNESVMIFTYRGPDSKGGKQVLKGKQPDGTEKIELFYEDILISKKTNDSTWGEPQGIESINTILHDAAVCLNFDGTQLFVYKNIGAGNGDLYLSTLINNTYSKPVLQIGLNSPQWEGSACFVPHRDQIIFASERKGGYGGKDLYIADRLKNNVWGNIKNLGPIINTQYDEDAPFVTTDGKILFFSSNNNNSLGGYDIFRSDLKSENWQTPYNLGAPINTKNDDKFFIVRADGKVGYYSSYKQGGKGEQDIYKIEPGIPGIPIEMLEVNGFVTVDNKPVGATIQINSLFKNRRFSIDLKSNSQSGAFLTNLPAGDKYELVVKVDKFPQQVIELSTINIDSFLVLNVFADFTSAPYDKKLQELTRTISELEFKKDAEFNKEEFAQKFGNTKKDSLAYKVQIGAYKTFENFNYNNILGFPKIIRSTDSDYITRFIMGHFDTYNEALKLLNELKETKFLKGAFIIANYKGKKKYLHELITEKILSE